MTAWYQIAKPHADIRSGDFDEAVFAANLADVADETAPDDYRDPYLFFRKTYLTDGLERLLRDVHDRLTQGKGPGVVELQTPFGGGKTHSLVTVYHYLKHGDEVRDQLPADLELIRDASVSAIVGTNLNPAEGSTSEGITRKTLWGEIAFQLGGEAAYEQIAGNDIDRISPGKRDLTELLRPYQPFVLLFDEVLEYVVRARGVPVHDDSLGAQTLGFFNELTEAVASLDNGLLVATLPSSDVEDFGDRELQNLQQIERIFGRVESIAAPVRDDEVHSIIRQRLFEEIEDPSAVNEIVDRHFDKYRQHKSDLPDKVGEAEFRRQMVRSYPFHPDVINLLYEKWSTFPSFQRTRGALRLLANVIEYLYEGRREIDLILPGDISLDRPEIRREFLKHIGTEYDGIISSDIAGGDAKSQAMDRTNPEWNRLAERIATSIFLHSFSAGESESGVKLPYIKLAVLRPGDTAAMVTEVLQRQARELWYLNQRGEEYFFSSVPNLNRMVLDKKEVIGKETLRAELRKHVNKCLGSRMRPFLWPESSETLPDNSDIKLAVLSPYESLEEDELKSWVQRRGDGFRVNKNTVFFAVPDSSRLGRTEDHLREMLALTEIQADFAGDERPGMGERRTEVKRRLQTLKDQISERVLELYRTVAIPSGNGGLEVIDLGQPSLAQSKIDTWYWRKLTDSSRHQKILEAPPSPAMLRAKFLDDRDRIGLDVLLSQFYRETALPIPEDRSLVAQAIAKGVEQGMFGYGMVVEGEIEPETVKIGAPLELSWIGFGEDEVLVEKELAKELTRAAREAEESDTENGSTEDGEDEDGEDEVSDDGDEEVEETGEERVHRVALRADGISTSDIAAFAKGVLEPLSHSIGEFQFAVEFDITSDDGIPSRVIETQVRETLRQLDIDISDLASE